MLDGSVVSEVFVVLCLRFKFQGEGISFGPAWGILFDRPMEILSTGEGVVPQSTTWVLLPLTGERVPGGQSQQMSTSASLFSLLFISLPDH